MSEFAGLEARLSGLEKQLETALDRITQAVTPKGASEAAASVRDLQAELAAELRSRGLTMKDLDAAAEAKFQGRIDERVNAILSEREAAFAAENGDGDDDPEADEPGVGKKLLDGLGGIRNVKPS